MTKNFDQFYDAHQGARRPAPALLPPRRPRRRAARRDDQPLVHALPLRRAERRRERAAGLDRPRDERLPAEDGTVVTATSRTSTTLTVPDSSQLTLRPTLTVPSPNSTGTVTNTTRVITVDPRLDARRARAAVATAAGQKVANGATVEPVCATANPTPYAEWPDPAASVANVNFTAGGLTSGGLTFQPGARRPRRSPTRRRRTCSRS